MAVELADAGFQSTLDRDSTKKAGEELNELNDADRTLAVQTLRQWVLQQNWLRSPTGIWLLTLYYGFLLRFLRARKYSQLSARTYIENYWTNNTKAPFMFQNIDPADPAIQEIIRSGYMYSPMRLDKHGRRVGIIRPSCVDTNVLKNEWTLDMFMRMIAMFYEWVMSDENSQVNGLVLFMDNTDMTFGQFKALFAHEHIRQFMAYFDIILHGKSLTGLYEEFGMSVLSTEYLPDEYEGPNAGTISDNVESMIEDVNKSTFRDYIVEISRGKYGVDLDKKKSNSVPSASFRKLGVD